MSDDILRVIELAKRGECSPEEWESLPIEIRHRILEIRIQVSPIRIDVPPVIYHEVKIDDVKIDHNVKIDVPKPAELGFKAGLGWNMGKGMAESAIGCFWLLIIILIFGFPVWWALLVQPFINAHH